MSILNRRRHHCKVNHTFKNKRKEYSKGIALLEKCRIYFWNIVDFILMCISLYLSAGILAAGILGVFHLCQNKIGRARKKTS